MIIILIDNDFQWGGEALIAFMLLSLICLLGIVLYELIRDVNQTREIAGHGRMPVRVPATIRHALRETL